MANHAVPVIVQIVISYLVVSWLVRLKRRHKATPTGTSGREAGPSASASLPSARPAARSSSQDGAVRREEVMLNGVRWHVTFRPRRDLTSGTRSLSRDVYVEEPPRCPKCGLGVVETRSWLGYTWSCPECGLRKRSSRSITDVAQALARVLH